MNETVTHLPGEADLRINPGRLGRSLARGMDK